MDTERYQKGVIYRIVCKDPTIKDVYVGSLRCNFTQRKYGHKTHCNNKNNKNYNAPVYKFIRENGGWDNWEMIEIIKYPCNTKRELETKEREYIEMLGGTLNKHIPTKTKPEYYQENKQMFIDKAKEWKANNREAVNKSEQKYRDKNKETRTATIMCGCGKNYTKQNKARHDKTQRHIKWIGLT